MEFASKDSVASDILPETSNSNDVKSVKLPSNTSNFERSDVSENKETDQRTEIMDVDNAGPKAVEKSLDTVDKKEDIKGSVDKVMTVPENKEKSKDTPVSFLASLFPAKPIEKSAPMEIDNVLSSCADPVKNVNEGKFESKQDPQNTKDTKKEVMEKDSASAVSTLAKGSEFASKPSEEIVKRTSPRLQSSVSESSLVSETAEKMESSNSPLTSQSPLSSNSPKNIPSQKNATKQLPIAGKTMRQRKPSTSPNGSEPKRVHKNKSSSPSGKNKKKPPAVSDDLQDGRNDFYCWVCHKEGEVLCCELCPRVFHAKCLNMTEEPEGDWFCPECETITNAECKETQSKAMSMLTLDQFSLLLRQVIQRMKIPMSEPFLEPVDTKMFPDYRDYVFHPMDLSTIEKNVRKKKYGCPEAFISEFKWVIHNCIIYNSLQSKLTQNAKQMLKVAERELNEIEVCPECYLNSCRKRENWFCEPCKELHPLVWAKLQGFPHWPAKALRIEKGQVDVRFFGQHDRAWIPLSGCYLISKELPLPIKAKKKNKGPASRGSLDSAMQEMQIYIDNIIKLTGEFEYAPPRTLLTHIDLCRKSGSAKSLGAKTGQDAGAKVGATADFAAKDEMKDIPPGKDLIRSRALDSLNQKKAKMVTTSGEHPTRLFATKKKKASMELLSKTIESCKASCGIDTLQDIKMNPPSDETTSSSEEDDSSEGKEKSPESKHPNSEKPSSSTAKPAEDDDSDAELVIDLGDMDDHADTGNDKKTGGPAPSKPLGSILKKSKPEDVSVSGSKQPLKSILQPTGKSADERKKMLAKALSEKIGGKRKHENDASGSSPKISRLLNEKRDGSPIERIGKTKDWKKSGQNIKESSNKPKPSILKTSELPIQCKDGSERRVSDQYKHKGKDSSFKSILKKPLQQDKPGRAPPSMPTEADTRKLFNGGRIPRKNVPTNISDEEQDRRDDVNAMDTSTNQNSRLRGSDKPDSNIRSVQTKNTVSNKTSMSDQQQPRTAVTEDIARANLKKYSDKVMDTVQRVFYEMYTDMMVPLTANAGSEAATPAAATAMHEVAQLRLELQRLKWMHEQEIAELKHNHDLAIAEIRQSLEFDKKQMLLEAKEHADLEKKHAVDETKRKQWCAYCSKEAIFYCCWNTSYCDYPCQQKHWPQHMSSCLQAKDTAGQSAVTEKTSESSSMHSKGPNISQATFNGSLTSKAITSTVVANSTKVSADVNTPSSKINKSCANEQKIARAMISSVSVDRSVKKLDSAKVQKALPAQPSTIVIKSSGSAISAIGARLLAARQRHGNDTSLKGTEPIGDSSLTKVSKPDQTDHVKVEMESPLSPESSPISSVGVKQTTKTDSIHLPVSDTNPIKSTIAVGEKPKMTATSEENNRKSLVTETKNAVPKFTSILTDKTANKKAIISSPSAVASIIAALETPLSSELMSSAPDKKHNVTKVKPPTGPDKTSEFKIKQSLEGSAFTKVVSVASHQSKSFSRNTDPTNKIQNIEKESDLPDEPKGTSLVSPVLSGSYLSSSPKTLHPKSKTPPITKIEMEDSDNNVLKAGGSPKQILPSSNELKPTDSDTATEPMETSS